MKSHCVFLRGFRAKRILTFFKTLKAAAGPQPDDPDNEPESSIELLREPAIPDVGMLSIQRGDWIDGPFSIATHSSEFWTISRK